MEVETVRKKIEKEGRDEANEDTIQKHSHNTADINEGNVDINHAGSTNKEPIRIIENDLSDSKKD